MLIGDVINGVDKDVDACLPVLWSAYVASNLIELGEIAIVVNFIFHGLFEFLGLGWFQMTIAGGC
jgi:hypothetical protein